MLLFLFFISALLLSLATALSSRLLLAMLRIALRGGGGYGGGKGGYGNGVARVEASGELAAGKVEDMEEEEADS